jgi:hypothetical protein
VKLALPALCAVVIALSLLMPVLMPKPASPGVVEQVTLQEPRGGEQRAAARDDTVTPDRRSRDRHRPSRAAGERAAHSKVYSNAQSISRAEGVGRADATPPAVDSPTNRPRSDSAPRQGGSPTPRTTPVRERPPAPDESSPQGDRSAVDSESADSPEAEATTAGVDPPGEPEPTDPPDPEATSVGVDPSDEPELADGDPLAEAP